MGSCLLYSYNCIIKNPFSDDENGFLKKLHNLLLEDNVGEEIALLLLTSKSNLPSHPDNN